MVLRDSCRVRTADRLSQPGERRSAVRTLRNPMRVFAQGDLVRRRGLNSNENHEIEGCAKSPPSLLGGFRRKRESERKTLTVDASSLCGATPCPFPCA